jgi:hypothetical protein
MFNLSGGSYTLNLFQSMYLLGVDQLNGVYVASTAFGCIVFAAIAKNSLELAVSHKDRAISLSLVSGLFFLMAVVVMLGSSSQTFLYFNFQVLL